MKVLIWFVSNDGRFFNSAMTILARQNGGLGIVGCTAVAPVQLQFGDKNVDFIPLDKVAAQDFDVLLVVGAKQVGMSDVVKAARRLKLSEDKLLGDWIVCIPGFALDKYRRLQRSRLSIFAMNCFGGLISNTLGLPFRSPIVNMFFHEYEYIRFLRAPRVYMEEKLIFKEKQLHEIKRYYFPVFTLGNVDLVMNHYRDFDAAKEAWYRRKDKINWYNLFVTAYTESEEFAREFDALPFGKKVCFVPFKSDADSAWYINPEIKPGLAFWDVVNHFGTGEPFYYDPFDMLLYGKKTPLIEM